MKPYTLVFGLIFATLSCFVAAKDLIVFSNFGNVEESQVFGPLFAKYQYPNAEVVVLTDNYEQVSSIPIFKELSIKVDRFPKDPRADKLEVSYRHSSSNSPDFELNCIRRFLWMERYVSSPRFNDSVVAHLDMDLLLFSNESPLLKHDNFPLFSLHNYSTYYSRWTPSALSEFSKFIMSFYEQDNVSLGTAVQKFGNAFPNEKVEQSARSKGLGLWLPADFKAKQFSDMHLFRAWLNSLDSDEANVIWKQAVFRMPPHYQAITSIRNALGDKKACVPKTGSINSIKWERLGTHSQYEVQMEQPRLPNSEASPWGIHFQGSACKKMICLLMCPKIAPEHQMLIECCTAKK
jgi:hypothetical protein